ncbi:MAG TPA: M1 family metallopeptidase [Vicinamibacterales bacterium]
MAGWGSSGVAVGLLLVFSGADLSGQAVAPSGTARSPRNASYQIDARLDVARHTIAGRERLTWRNTSARAADTLQFHLYYNAWRNERSTWMRERRLANPSETSSYRPDDWGAIDISALSIVSGGRTRDLTPRLRTIAPDDGNADDRTVVELPLDAPVRPGETIDVEIAWTSHVPRTFARTGVLGDYYFIAQWFPKIGVLQDDGWNCHQFHYATEFFADFGVYDVRLTVPSGWIVGATGVERDVTDDQGTRTHHFYQEDVHDFAWTTSPHYVEHLARFEHPTLPPVEMRLLQQPEHEGQERRHFAATRATLRYYGEWFGPYPYGHITIVDPAWQSGTGGMEYPTLFTAGTRWLAPEGGLQPEGVTVHEAGHQFWYGIVATNEFENAWMDEGFNTFSTARVIEQQFQPNYYVQRYFGAFVPWVFRSLPQSREVDGDRLAGYRANARQDVQSTPTFRYWPGSSGSITYNKTALWMHTLERQLGWPVLQRVLSTYFQRYAFKHPRPQDFFDVANEVSGQDLSWYFDQVYRGSQTFDYGVDFFRSESSPEGFHTTLVARRYGDGVFPVTVRVTYADGQQTTWSWDGRDRWKMFKADGRAEAVSAEVDPERVLLLDVNRTNNSMSLHPHTGSVTARWSLTWLVWLQDQLLTYGFFV